jgi:trans-2-enoyl-CoA reductase
MPLQIVKRRSRGFICVNAHPEGCRRNVERWVDGVRGKIPVGQNAPKNVLVIGASTGYGLATRVTAAWGCGAKTLGVFFERPPDGDKTATAGHYNTVALHSIAKRDGLFAASINGDAFSDEIKRAAAETIRKEMAPVDLVIYSLASPKRTEPRTGKVHNSALKPVGQAYTNRTIELDSEKVVSVTLQPANEDEIADTVAVMGGDDWRRWMEMLLEEKLLAPGARTLAYSYIGPQITWPIYRDGTIGQAKKDLEARGKRSGCHARVSIGRQRLGFGEQGGGDAGLRGDSCCAAVFKFASPGDEKEKSGRRAARTDAAPVHGFSLHGTRAQAGRGAAPAPGRSRNARRRARGSRGALAAGDHGKSSRNQRIRPFSARVSRLVRL